MVVMPGVAGVGGRRRRRWLGGRGRSRGVDRRCVGNAAGSGIRCSAHGRVCRGSVVMVSTSGTGRCASICRLGGVSLVMVVVPGAAGIGGRRRRRWLRGRGRRRRIARRRRIRRGAAMRRIDRRRRVAARRVNRSRASSRRRIRRRARIVLQEYVLERLRVFQRHVSVLRSPGVGVVESRIGNDRCPMVEHLLFLRGGRHHIVTTLIGDPVTAAECLKYRDDAGLRNSSGFGGSDSLVNHAVVDCRAIRPHRIRIDSEEVDMGVLRGVRIREAGIIRRSHVHHGDERLRTRNVGVNPIGLSLQVCSGHEGIPLPRGIWLVLKEETVDVGITDVRFHSVDEALGDAVTLIEPDEALHACRQSVHLLHRRNVGKIEACLSWGEVTLCVDVVA